MYTLIDYQDVLFRETVLPIGTIFKHVKLHLFHLSFVICVQIKLGRSRYIFWNIYNYILYI